MIGPRTVKCDVCSSLIRIMNWIHISSDVVDERKMGPEYVHIYEASCECPCGNEVSGIAEGYEYPDGAGVDEWEIEYEGCSEIDDEEYKDNGSVPVTTGIPNIDWVLKEKHITELLDIQEKFISIDEEYDNILVVAPTTSGKTIIAEFLLSEVFFLDKKDGIAIYVAPMHALVSEKIQDFTYFQKLNAFITKNYHKVTDNPRTILILTPERVLDFLRDYPNFIPKIKLLIFDEIHLIQDFTRGLLYEMIITLLKEALESKIVALSATLENSEDLAIWLDAEELKSTKRPVDLKSAIISYTNNDNRREKIKDLVLKVLKNDKQIIIFEKSKPSVNSLAVFIADAIGVNNNSNQLTDQCKELFNNNYSIDRKNLYCISRRVAFHHADIKSEQKTWIEESFRNEELKVIVASPTLAMGLNLPADVVIVASHRLGRGELSLYMYKQMIGRAGRYRLSDMGWSFILLPEKRTNLLTKFKGVIPPVKSTLMESRDERRIDYLLLWLLGTRLFNSVTYLKKLLSHSFFELMRQESPSKIKSGILSEEILKRIDPQQSSVDLVDPIVKRLENDGLLIQDDDSIDLTPLGSWAAYSQIPIDEFLSVFQLFYPECNIELTSPTLEQLITLIKVLSIQGLTPTDTSKSYFPFTMQLLNSQGISPQEYLTGEDRVPTDITLAGVLFLWIEGEDIDELLEKIHCYHGSWQRHRRGLIEKLRKFAYHMPEEYKTVDTNVKLRDFIIMLEKGVSHEMVPLVRIFGVGRITTLCLFRKYGSLRAIISTNIDDLSDTRVGKRLLGPTMAKKIKNELILPDSDLPPNLFSLMAWAKSALKGENTPFPETEFKICIKQPEDLFYERKTNIQVNTKPEKSEFLRDFMSLANAPDPRPRLLIIGVDNDGNIIGANVDNNMVAQIIESGLRPLVNYSCKEVKIDGKIIPIQIIQPSEEVVESNVEINLNEHTFLRKKEVWARTNQGKRQLKGKEIEKLAARKRKNFSTT